MLVHQCPLKNHKSYLKFLKFDLLRRNLESTDLILSLRSESNRYEITYCLVAIVQHDMKLERSIYEVLQILGISLTDKTHLRDLFDKSNFKNVNALYGSCEPNLFNF